MHKEAASMDYGLLRGGLEKYCQEILCTSRRPMRREKMCAKLLTTVPAHKAGISIVCAYPSDMQVRDILTTYEKRNL